MSPKTPSDAAFVLYVWLIKLQNEKESPNDEIIVEKIRRNTLEVIDKNNHSTVLFPYVESL